MIEKISPLCYKEKKKQQQYCKWVRKKVKVWTVCIESFIAICIFALLLTVFFWLLFFLTMNIGTVGR